LLWLLTFAQRKCEAKCTTLSKKKYVMPEIDREEAGPQVAGLIAFAEKMTDDANAAYEKVLALKAEVTRLKKARKRGSRTPK